MKPTLSLIQGTKTARTRNPVESRIQAFLAGDNAGTELFVALYGHVEREPIPERLWLAALLAPNQKPVPAAAKLA